MRHSSAAWSRWSITVASTSRPDGFVVNLTRVDRPEAPPGDFEQGVKAADAIGAGLGVQAHAKAAQRTVLRRCDRRCKDGEGSRAGAIRLGILGGAGRARVRLTPGPGVVGNGAGPSHFWGMGYLVFAIFLVLAASHSR
jgi:hypothetical protein